MNIEEIYKIFIEHPKVCTDTRQVVKGSIFFALKGENFNGNKYCEDAIAKGCEWAVSDEKKGDRIIKVDDVLKTLQDLAQFHRRKMKAKVIGITGSNGKTTTKELMNSILSESNKVLATEGNLNNHIGVPLTLLKVTDKHEIAIIEMGANQPGDIAELCEIAMPEWGVITNIGKAHLEGFGSIETTLETKSALYKSVYKSGGKIFLNADDPLLKKACPERHPVTYGVQAKSIDIYGIVEEEHPKLKVSWSNFSYHSPTIETTLFGAYNIYNILAAVSVANELGMSHKNINDGIRKYVPNNNRSQIIKTNNNTLLMDAYNANPASMEMAIKSFKSRNAPNSMLILGDMNELGESSNEEHKKIIDLVKSTEFPAFFVGEKFLKNQQPSELIQYFEERKEVEEHLKKNKIKDHFILLKASRSIGLEKLESLL